MKHQSFFVFVFLFLANLLNQNLFAATITGNAFLDGQTDHSGISIELTMMSPPPIPAIGLTGGILLLASISLMLFRKQRKNLTSLIVIAALTGLGCLVCAFTNYSTETSVTGEYSFLNAEPGQYTLTASRTGYIPVTLDNVPITEGLNSLADIILYSETSPPEPLTILVDFGIDTHETISPDINDNWWNNLSTNTSLPPSGILTNVVTTDNSPSVVQLTISGFGNGANAAGTTVPDTDALGSLGISNATRDSFFVSTETGTVVISGLIPNRYYRLECFGSRDASDLRVTLYTATGMNTVSASLQTSGSGIGQIPEPNANRSALAILDDVRPSVSGTITLSVSVESGDFGYINALRITELDMAPGPNLPPEAHNVFIVGAPAESRTITVYYGYYDADGDPEGDTVIEWQFDSPPFDNPVTLQSGLGSTIQIPEQEGLFVRAAVTPIAVSGVTTGETAYSAWLGPIAPENAITVFHIGNSFTRWGDVPLQIYNLAEDAGYTHVFGDQLTDGMGLEYHWANGLANGVWTRGTPSRLELDTGSWDWLALQPMSREWEPAHIGSFINHAMLYSALADSNNTQVLLYQYWNYLDEDQNIQDEINAAFETVYNELIISGFNVYIIPVGEAFTNAVDNIAGLEKPDLYQDNIHPGDIGYYLSALVHYSIVYGESPYGLTNIAVSADFDSNDPIAIDPALASALQDTAWNTVLNHPYSGVLTGGFSKPLTGVQSSGGQ
jgi:hypothetical protein